MRCYLYAKQYPDGKLFTDENEMVKAIHDEGAVDHPNKVGQKQKPEPAARPMPPVPAKKHTFDVLSLTVPKAERKIAALEDPELLRAVLAREQDRLNGPRSGIIQAVEELEDDAA